MNNKIGLACSLVLLSILACRSTLFTAPTPTPSPTPWPVAELRFKDAETGRRFRLLDRCIKNIADDSWHTTSYQTLGNFYESRWCRGAGVPDDCQIADGTIDKRNQHVLELNTLYYSQSAPDVFGLGFQALWIPQTIGWGALFSFAENGSNVVADGWGVTFRNYGTPAGSPTGTVDLGWNYRYTISGPNPTTFDIPANLPLREDLALYLSAPEAMRDRGLDQSQALSQKVVGAIQAHQVNTCDLGPYQGGGIPPVCTPRPLTSSEEATELARAKAYFTEQEQLLRDHYREMYAAWMMAFPFDQCWQ